MGISFNAASLLNGNGIDVTSVVNAILSEQNGPLTAWQNQQTDLSTQAGLLTGYNNNLTNLQAAVLALANPTGPLAAQSATSSNSGILTASAHTTATAGTHQIVVSNLATTGTIYTDPLTNGTTSFLTSRATSGDIKLQVGGRAARLTTSSITQGSNDTLNTLAAYINNQNWGVTANVVTDANGARLALYSQASGTPGALAITNNDTGLSFNTPVGGTNASLTIDGVPYSSATNTITGAIAGVTLIWPAPRRQLPCRSRWVPTPPRPRMPSTISLPPTTRVVGDLNTQFTVDPDHQHRRAAGWRRRPAHIAVQFTQRCHLLDYRQ